MGLTECIETRHADGVTWRTYQTADGRIIETCELPIAVLSKFGPAAIQRQLEVWHRGQDLAKRRAKMDEMIRAGIRPAVAARELGVTDAAVRLRRKKLREDQGP